MNAPPWLILPVETKVRELDAKAYLACVAAEAGFRVILGEQRALRGRLGLLPRGFYLDKSLAPSRVRFFQRLNRLGFRPLAWCEEGLVYRDRQAYLHERIAPGAFGRTEAFFAWGQNQAGDVRSIMGDDERIHVTGNPRFDLLRPGIRELYEPAAKSLRRRFGSYLLINTNFARYNHFYGRDQVLEILRARGILRDEGDERFFTGWIDFLGRVFESFVDMLPRLARAFPDRTIVLRPHPSENHETWRRIAAELPNVKVIYEGSVLPWILAAELSIHNSCTTGLEGALLGRPVLAYRPVLSETYDSFLPNRVSVNLTSFDDLVHGIEDALAGRYRAPLATDQAVCADVERYIASRDGTWATERIITHISNLARATSDGNRRRYVARGHDCAGQFVRSVAKALSISFHKSQDYTAQKFPGLTAHEVVDLVGRYRDLMGRFDRVRVRPLYRNAVRVTSE